MTDKDEKYLNSLLKEFLMGIIDFFLKTKLNSLVKEEADLEELFELCQTASNEVKKIEKIKSAFALSDKKKKKKNLMSKREKYETCLKELKKIVSKSTNSSAEKGRKQEKSGLKKKLKSLDRTLGLTKEESLLVKTALLTFLFDLDYMEGLSDCESLPRNIKYFSQLTQIDKFNLSRIISEKNILIASGLFYSCEKNSPLELFQISEDLAKLLLDPEITDKSLFETYFSFTTNRGLDMSYFSHLKNETLLTGPLLKSALEKKTDGVNMLLYGRPGTGKTEFAFSLVKHLGLKPVIVNGEKDRISQYRLCQKVYATSKDSVVIFDEADAVLSTCRTYNNREDENYRDKASIISLLENNPIPTIWIVNATYDMHRAVKRRFSYSINFRKLPSEVTGRIINEKIKKDKLPEDIFNPEIKEYVEKKDFSMGQLSLALERTNQMVSCPGKSLEKASDTFKAILSSMGKLEGPKKGAAGNSHEATDSYNLDFINTDSDPENLIQRIGRYYEIRNDKSLAFSIHNLNLLFFGPPGAGKTELVRYIAQKLGKKIIIKKSSDLLDMYVGNTEKNINEAFEEAEETDSILVLDEADSFFQKRSNAMRSWEISQVNEILNAMEQFRGVLICTTNFIDHFDKASLRRFAFKVKFNYLSKGQRLLSFQRIFGTLLNDVEDNCFERKLEDVNKLTIGDFKTVYQQIIYEREIKSGEVVNLLAKESLLKSRGEGKTVGFTR